MVDISRVSDLYQQLNDALDQEKPISLDTGAIERIDASALQMFASFIQEVQKRSQDIHWKNPAEALLRSADLLGMKQILLLEK